MLQEIHIHNCKSLSVNVLRKGGQGSILQGWVEQTVNCLGSTEFSQAGILMGDLGSPWEHGLCNGNQARFWSSPSAAIWTALACAGRWAAVEKLMCNCVWSEGR